MEPVRKVMAARTDSPVAAPTMERRLWGSRRPVAGRSTTSCFTSFDGLIIVVPFLNDERQTIHRELSNRQSADQALLTLRRKGRPIDDKGLTPGLSRFGEKRRVSVDQHSACWWSTLRAPARACQPRRDHGPVSQSDRPGV